jgi:hypothetical protein
VLFISQILNAQNPYQVKSETEPPIKSTTSEKTKKEMEFLFRSFPYVSLADWTPGMKFIGLPSTENEPVDLKIQGANYHLYYKNI